MSHDTRAIFSYVNLICPDLDLDLFSALVSYLHGMIVIPSVAFLLSLRLQLSLVSGAGKAKESALAFDLTLTQHLTSLRKI